jgi:anti-sigma-K factor RskA
MTHDELRELTGGYALGVLSDTERRALEAHLPTCPECDREVREFTLVAGALAYAVPQQDPPAALRERVLGTAARTAVVDRKIEGPTRSTWSAQPWLLAAASLAAVALGLYTLTLRERITTLEGRLREANARAESTQREVAVARAMADEAAQANEILSADDVRRIDLVGQKDAPNASGRAYWSPSRGRVLFTAANLPPPAAGRQYQLWVIPPGRPPISAGMIDLEGGGRARVLADSSNAAVVGTVAVSLEPAGGVPSPTGPIVLAGSL